MKSFIVGAALAIGLMAPGAAYAVTFDAFDSFNGSNPGGPFFYNGATGPTTAAPLVAGGAACPLGTTCVLSPSGSGIDSGVYKAGAGTPDSVLNDDTGSTIMLPKDQLIVDPDDFATGIFFVAPFDGEFTFNAAFNALDSDPNGVTIFRIMSNSNAPPPFLALLVGSTNGVPNSLTFSETKTLSTGQVYGFRIGAGAAPNFDLTGFNFSASAAVPEPATWAVMLLGFAGLGAALRRRRAVGMAEIG